MIDILSLTLNVNLSMLLTQHIIHRIDLYLTECNEHIYKQTPNNKNKLHSNKHCLKVLEEILSHNQSLKQTIKKTHT